MRVVGLERDRDARLRQHAGVGVDLVVRLVRADAGRGRADDDGDVPRGQRVGELPRLVRAAQDHLEAEAVGEREDAADLLGRLHVEDHRLVAAHHRHHRFHREVRLLRPRRAGREPGLDVGIRLRVAEERLERQHLPVGLVAIALPCAPEAAAAPGARVGHDHRGRGAHRHLLRRPSQQIQQRRLPAHQAAARRGDGGGHAVAARDRDDLRIGIDGDERRVLRIEVAQLLLILAAGHRVDLGEAEAGAGVDHAGIDEQAAAVQHRVAGLRRGVGADRLDLAVADHDGAPLDPRSGDGHDGDVADRPAARGHRRA